MGLVISTLALPILAQTTRDQGNAPRPSDSKVFLRTDKKANKKDRKQRNYRTAPNTNEFLEARLREKSKLAAEMKQPQYADKMYFGHKRLPKKRPVHKRKFCKVCGIVH